MTDSFQVPPGLVVTTTYGSITQETAQCLADARSFNDKEGLTNVQYIMVPGSLVDKARNEAVRQMLKAQAGWLLFIDGDMTFPFDAIRKLIQTAYAGSPHFDVVGGYCNLRGELAVPTIDTGTGTWESWYPGSGVVEVIRTGAAFLLTKRHVFERLTDPWFRMRVPTRAADFMAELDNFARIKFDGQNPLRGSAWERLEQAARDDASIIKQNFTPHEVGEDSGFCDRVKLAGFRIGVDTDVVTGHVDRRIVDWQLHKKAMDDRERFIRQACGLWD